MRKFLVFLSIVGLVFAVSAPISAQDKSIEERVKALEDTIGAWSFYGSARYATFYADSNLDADRDDAGTEWALQGNSRIGANVKKGAIGGKFEYGSGPNLRLLFGTYNFGDGTFLIGQDYTPLGIFYSNQVYGADTNLIGWGQVYGGRVPQVKILMKGLQVAFVENKSADKLNAASGDVDILLPKLEARYTLKQDLFFADLFGAFSTYKIEDVTIGTTNYGDETVNAWALGIGGGLSLDVVTLKAMVYMGQNFKNFGIAHTDAKGAYFDADGKLINEDNMGAMIVALTKIDKYTLEAGFGYVTSEYDVSGAKTDTAMAYYLNATIPVYGGFSVVPEVGFLDYGDGRDGKDEKKDTTYIGAKWQINF